MSNQEFQAVVSSEDRDHLFAERTAHALQKRLLAYAWERAPGRLGEPDVREFARRVGEENDAEAIAFYFMQSGDRLLYLEPPIPGLARILHRTP